MQLRFDLIIRKASMEDGFIAHSHVQAAITDGKLFAEKGYDVELMDNDAAPGMPCRWKILQEPPFIRVIWKKRLRACETCPNPGYEIIG